jgi:ACS family D-galactonate transporter-like MFS transporter
MSPSKPHRKTIPGMLLAALVLLAISAFINYVDRGNLSVAAPMLKDELGISASQLGVLLSAFFWTYACLQPFAGWLVDRWNVNWVFASGFFLWSSATAATGLVHTFAALIILRLLLGVGESVAYPSYCKILALNFEEEHRGLANAAISAGQVLGPGFGLLFGGLLMARFGWRPFFVVLGVGSLFWLIPWVKWMPKTRAAGSKRADAPSLSEFLRLRSAWGTSIGLFSSNYVNYFLITWLPFYLVR